MLERPAIFLPLSLSLSSLLLACTDPAPPPPELTAAVAPLSSSACQATPLTAFNTAGNEGRLVLSPDGRLALWHRDSAEFGIELVESRLVGGAWTPPARPAFASAYTEFDPFIALDGRTVFYTSFRPVTGTDQRPDGDLWKVERTAGGWATPVHLGGGINTDANEFFPSQTADGTLFWNSDREGGAGAWDLWHARRTPAGWATPAPLPGDVNTSIWEFNPTLTPGGTLLAFGSLDPDPAAPYSDVFFSLRLAGEYSARVNAGACINTELEEFHPTIDWARGRLIFVRNDPGSGSGTGGDFYEVSLPAALIALVGLAP